MRKRLREFTETAGAQFFLVLQAVIQLKLLTNYLEAEQYGLWALILSLSTLMIMLPFSAFDQAVARLDSEDGAKKEPERFVGRVIQLYLALYGIWVVIWVLLAALLEVYPVGPEFLIPFLVFALTEILKASGVGLANARRLRRQAAAFRLTDLIARTTVLGIPFLTNLEPSLPQIVWTLAMTNAVVVLLAWLTLRPKIELAGWQEIRETLRQLSGFAWPLLTWAVFGWLHAMVNRWYLAAFLDSSAVAEYAVAVSVSFFAPNFAYTILASFVLPIAYRSAGGLTRKIHFGLVLALFSGSASVATFMLLFGEWFVELMTSPVYAGIAPWLPILTLSSGVYVAAMISTVEIYRAKQTRRLLVPGVLPGALSLTLGAPLVYLLGLSGALAAYVIGQLAYAVFVFPISTRFINQKEEM